LKPGVTFETLEQVAMEMSNNEAAKRLQADRVKLFEQIFGAYRNRA